jgi:DNA-binding CsgD family transcriptional regulator
VVRKSRCQGPITSWSDDAEFELALTLHEQTPDVFEAARTRLAYGAQLRRRDPATLAELTPQELQIALRVAEGRTTRETAAALFLSPKTVEYHLHNIYRKLAIRSRAELAAAISPDQSR